MAVVMRNSRGGRGRAGTERPGKRLCSAQVRWDGGLDQDGGRKTRQSGHILDLLSNIHLMEWL